MRVTNFATFSAIGMGVGLYAGRLIYGVYTVCCDISPVKELFTVCVILSSHMAVD